MIRQKMIKNYFNLNCKKCCEQNEIEFKNMFISANFVNWQHLESY